MARVATALIQFLWQGALIAGLYGIARRLSGRRQNAEFRYLLACAALATMAIAPIATFIVTASARHRSGGARSGREPGIRNTGHGPNLVRTLRRCGGRQPERGRRYLDRSRLAGGQHRIPGPVRGGLGRRNTNAFKQVRPAPAKWQRELDGMCRRVGLSNAVRLFVSAVVETPLVVGYLRPFVLVPVGALTGLDPEFLRALLAHELAHIRRHDYLVNILQCVVESALFYHPAVWWISNQIREERELCCDDAAVSSCGDPVVYARALAELESFRPAHPRPTLAAGGISLAGRIARLLGKSIPSFAAAPRPGPIVAALLVSAGAILAQRGGAPPTVTATSSLPAFEVAAIKPSDADTPLEVDFERGGPLLVTHATLRFLIKIAYDVSDQQIAGGPAWLSSRRFDVQARPDKTIPGDPENMTQDEVRLFHEPTRLRLQRLLAERFRLELRKESRPMPIFALVIGRNGIKMKPDSSAGDPVLAGSINRGALRATRADMDTVAHFLSKRPRRRGLLLT